MTEEKPHKQYDLEERTFAFAQAVRAFVRRASSARFSGRPNNDEPFQTIRSRAVIRQGFEPSLRFTI
jgi:hypothetical protein